MKASEQNYRTVFCKQERSAAEIALNEIIIMQELLFLFQALFVRRSVTSEDRMLLLTVSVMLVTRD